MRIVLKKAKVPTWKRWGDHCPYEVIYGASTSTTPTPAELVVSSSVTVAVVI